MGLEQVALQQAQETMSTDYQKRKSSDVIHVAMRDARSKKAAALARRASVLDEIGIEGVGVYSMLKLEKSILCMEGYVFKHCQHN